jgi:hypothetical protein
VELQGALPNLAKEGLSVVAVSYDPVPTLAAFASARGIGFPLLSDEGSEVIRRYGLLNETVTPGTRTYGVPWPGSFVLDRERRVVSRFFEAQYQERNTAASITVRAGGAGRGPSLQAGNDHLSLDAAASDEVVAPGSRVTLAFDITPRPNIHVYAPGASYQVVAIRIDPQPLLVVHDPVYPPSEIYHFVPLNERVPVYRKPFRLTRDVTIRATREAQQALRGMTTLRLSGALAYQACDDKICFTPRTLPFAFDLRVRPLDRP